MKLAAVDIGTNSMRLLIVDGDIELGRWQRVTGLGKGVDATGSLSEDAMDRTLVVLAEFGGRMWEAGVEKARAVATSASRNAGNRQIFFDRAELALGIRPDLISGEEEAELAFSGATNKSGLPEPHLVVDIGGGSTEFVTAAGGSSVEVGSVRLSDRQLPDRPPTSVQLANARAEVSEVLVATPVPVQPFSAIGVAGTWTSLAAMHLALPSYDDRLVDGAVVTSGDLGALVQNLSRLSLDETIATYPGLDPARAPVILAGALIAEGVFGRIDGADIAMSVHDLLDGVIAGLS